MHTLTVRQLSADGVPSPPIPRPSADGCQKGPFFLMVVECDIPTLSFHDMMYPHANGTKNQGIFCIATGVRLELVVRRAVAFLSARGHIDTIRVKTRTTWAVYTVQDVIIHCVIPYGVRSSLHYPTPSEHPPPVSSIDKIPNLALGHQSNA
jgi:hypothetical protein